MTEKILGNLKQTLQREKTTGIIQIFY